MAAKKKRPVFLNLFVIRLPVAGVSSIAHRITGALLVLSLPILFYGLERSLRDADGFAQVMGWLGSLPGRLMLLLCSAIFAQHFATGIRHLFLSMGIGLSPQTAARSAWATFVFTLATIAIVGVVLL